MRPRTGCSAPRILTAPSSSPCPLPGTHEQLKQPISASAFKPKTLPSLRVLSLLSCYCRRLCSTPKPIALEKAECESFRSPSLPGRIQQAFPWSPLCFCSAIPTPSEAATFQILPLSPAAELCVLGCSEHEIPALNVVAGAWNLLLCATVWFVVSQHDSSG